MVRKSFGPAIITLLLATASFAQAPHPTSTAPAMKEKKVCERLVATGSVMPRVTCHTKAEWDAIAAQSHVEMDRQRQDSTARAGVQSGR